MFYKQSSIALILIGFSSTVEATGLNFWESSASNSALGSANGAYAVDASILATAPSSMTQIDYAMVSASITNYRVDTDYYIFGTESDYSTASPIPAGFWVTPLENDWYVGMAAYSRTAGDITIPVLVPMLTHETRVRPISVSFSPSVAYQYKDISVGVTLEYQYASYLLEQTICGFRDCELHSYQGITNGWSGGLSVTWKVNDYLSFAANHKFKSDYGNEDIRFYLPAITSFYATFYLVNSLYWHNSYSLSRWNGHGIHYADYNDPVGLLRGSRDSKRYTTSFNYEWRRLSLRGGFSIDQAIDSYGGNDIRYRLGLAFSMTEHIMFDLTGFKEHYAHKQYSSASAVLVDVQNSGLGFSAGISYTFK